MTVKKSFPVCFVVSFFMVLEFLNPTSGSAQQVKNELLLPRKLGSPVTGMMYIGEPLDPGSLYISPFGSVHIRDAKNVLILAGDVSGTGFYVQDSDWDAGGNGFLRGTLEIDVEYNGTGAKLSGRWSGRMSGFYITGKFIAVGTGNCKGMILIANFVGGANGPFDYSGNIIGF